MLKINQKENIRFMIYYFDIRKIQFEGDNLLTITTKDDSITIEGKNFSAVENHFRENRIVSIWEMF